MLRHMVMSKRPYAVLPVAMTLAVLASCSQDAAEPVGQREAGTDKIRDVASLDCESGRTSVQVLDRTAEATGFATPEDAAQDKVAPDKVDREDWTQRTTTDATGAIYIDYLTDSGRLVQYVKPQQQPDGTWLVGQIAACEG